VSTGSVVVITGAASGIGRATAEWCVERGIAVSMLDRSEDVVSVGESIGAAHTACVDVRDADGIAAAVHQVAESHGVRGAVLSAGVGDLAPLASMSRQRMDRVIDVNWWGTINAVQALHPALMAAAQVGEHPSVVMVGSMSGIRPTIGEAPYSAAKAAVASLTTSLAMEWAPGIRVNGVAPGLVDTPLTEALTANAELKAHLEGRAVSGRVLGAREVAEVIGFLLGAGSSGINGVTIPVDGGNWFRDYQTHDVLSAWLV
jgi:NAD(P)-dependent dehydrogenase (short-subunit alcohol dehydrogenase family)